MVGPAHRMIGELIAGKTKLTPNQKLANLLKKEKLSTTQKGQIIELWEKVFPAYKNIEHVKEQLETKKGRRELLGTVQSYITEAPYQGKKTKGSLVQVYTAEYNKEQRAIALAERKAAAETRRVEAEAQRRAAEAARLAAAEKKPDLLAVPLVAAPKGEKDLGELLGVEDRALIAWKREELDLEMDKRMRWVILKDLDNTRKKLERNPGNKAEQVKLLKLLMEYLVEGYDKSFSKDNLPIGIDINLDTLTFVNSYLNREWMRRNNAPLGVKKPIGGTTVAALKAWIDSRTMKTTTLEVIERTEKMIPGKDNTTPEFDKAMAALDATKDLAKKADKTKWDNREKKRAWDVAAKKSDEAWRLMQAAPDKRGALDAMVKAQKALERAEQAKREALASLTLRGLPVDHYPEMREGEDYLNKAKQSFGDKRYSDTIDEAGQAEAAFRAIIGKKMGYEELMAQKMGDKGRVYSSIKIKHSASIERDAAEGTPLIGYVRLTSLNEAPIDLIGRSPEFKGTYLIIKEVENDAFVLMPQNIIPLAGEETVRRTARLKDNEIIVYFREGKLVDAENGYQLDSRGRPLGVEEVVVGTYRRNFIDIQISDEYMARVGNYLWGKIDGLTYTTMVGTPEVSRKGKETISIPIGAAKERRVRGGKYPVRFKMTTPKRVHEVSGL